jgi:serine/threonine protein kinase
VVKACIHELVLWRYLKHSNIVRFLGMAQEFKISLVSEWMAGGIINDFLRQHLEGDRTVYVHLYHIILQYYF